MSEVIDFEKWRLLIKKGKNMLNDKPENDVLDSFLSLVSWLETWKNEEGAYLGFVVHRYDSKRMFKIHDDTWAQSPIINGYINLFKKTENKRWLRRAELAGDLLVKRLDSRTGKYQYAGWENDKSRTLAHCALADCALLNLSTVMTEIRRTNKSKQYAKAARVNVDKYLIKALWNPNIHAFSFGDFDPYAQARVGPYSPYAKRYIANMNSVAAEALVKLFRLTGDKRYLNEYAIPVGQWLLEQQVASNGVENGGISYSNVRPKELVAIYTGLAMRGLDDLYLETGDKGYLEMMERASKHLINIRDPRTKLFYHGVFSGKVQRYPQFVAGAGIILKAIHDTMHISNKKYDLNATVEAVLKMQLPIGGFHNFVGYNTSQNRRKRGEGYLVWEDVVPIVGWNGFLFEFLSEFLPKEIPFVEGEMKKTRLFHSNFIYHEDLRKCVILGKKPIESVGFYKYSKKRKFGFAITPFKIVRRFLGEGRRVYRKILKW